MGAFSISFENNKLHDIEILDLNGKVIQKAVNITTNKWSFDISKFDSGTYLIKIYPENITYQIVKQ